MSDGQPWELLVRYGAGGENVSAEELAALSSWSEKSPEHARLLRRVSRLAVLSRVADGTRHTDAGWERLQQRLERRAVSESEDVRALPLPVPRRRSEAALSVSRAPRRRGWPAAGIAAAAAALLAVGVIGWPLLPTRAVELHEVAARRGERVELRLPDGSRVVLGAESRLRYATEGFARDRTLFLEGQAYFAVAHDARHPFVVHARGAAVQAVGTEFGVRAYEDDSTVHVAVAQGRVLMRTDSSAPGTGAVLDLGDLGEIDSAGRMKVRHDANLDTILGWVRGRLIYDMAPTADVVRDLERWYGVTIHIDGMEQNDLRVSMTIDPAQPASVSFQRLADVLDLRVVRSGDRVDLTTRPAAARR